MPTTSAARRTHRHRLSRAQIIAELKRDPLTRGHGLGLLLHEVRGYWMVKAVLRGSPAEAAEVRVGDRLLAVDELTLAGGDMLEVVTTIRTAGTRSHALSLARRSVRAPVTVQINAVPFPGLLNGEALSIWGPAGDGCMSCLLCRPRNLGWARCGFLGPRPCRLRCAVV